jgi:hypothetical protein
MIALGILLVLAACTAFGQLITKPWLNRRRKARWEAKYHAECDKNGWIH